MLLIAALPFAGCDPGAVRVTGPASHPNAPPAMVPWSAEVGRTKQPWALDALREIAQIRAQWLSYQEVVAALSRRGLGPESSTDKFVGWMRNSTDEDRVLLAEKRHLGLAIQRSVPELWLRTGYGTPILELNQGTWLAGTVDVLDSYESFVLAHADRPQHEVVRALLKANVLAVDGRSCYMALTVLHKWVGFFPGFSCSEPGATCEDMAFQAERSEEMLEWFDRKAHQLKWDERTRKFLTPEGLPFEL